MLKDAEDNQYKGSPVNNEKAVSFVAGQTKPVLSDVDIDIPVTNQIKSNTYALIIGNEDYSSFQTGLTSEVNVDFAINDARIFKEYCYSTLGIPEKQIKFLANATAGQMNQGIVKKETALNGKIQTPQCSYSPAVENVWTNWKLK
jgi:hypothetical protein